MAGQLGNKTVSIQNLEVVSIDEERGLLLVKGGVPGAIGGWVSITDAKKKTLPPHAPYPIGSKIIKNENKTQEVKKNKETNDSLSAEKKIVEKVVDDKSEVGSNGK